MLRKSPLKRKARLKPRSGKKRHLLRVVGVDYAAGTITTVAEDSLEVARRREWLGRQSCAFGRVSSDPCTPGIQRAHQDEGKGIGIKTHWSTEIPLCPKHHDMLGGQAKHKTVIPWERLLARAFHHLAADRTEREWREVQVHEEARLRKWGRE